ncbi:MAG: hypothetical protein M5U28_32270 [Sandaracinaceae bacterium]|nr:hypothetical protein [Sandaracinaceae bacterium]
MPSGKITIDEPARTSSAAAAIAATAAVCLPRSTKTWPPARIARPKSGIRSSSAFARNPGVTGSALNSATMSTWLWWLAMSTYVRSGSRRQVP